MIIKFACFFILCSLQIINLCFVNNTFAQGINIASSQKTADLRDVPAVWHKLITQLANDGIQGTDINLAFLELSNVPSQKPMGYKMQELYTNKFVPKPKSKVGKKPALKVYKNVVNQVNVDKCKDFLQIHEKSFDYIEKKYEVPREIAVALLFVETRLGTWLGEDSALFMLASMSQSTEVNNISTWLPKFSGYKNNVTWMNQTMVKRADWAYKELYALLQYARNNNIDPTTMPGSMYGAIGICQFMPSNIAKYGADGNGDGIINLFVEADAIASLAHYLYLHGWRKGQSLQKQHKILKTYNRIDIYANTILALNDSIIKNNNLKIKIK